jgi:hypothetical protein|tara:strand:+ start:9905 stop:10015 length:111 start_codon:yes stop_codon:yes gene_type:complete
MKENILFFAIIWAIVFVVMGLFIRFKFKDKFDELDD